MKKKNKINAVQQTLYDLVLEANNTNYIINKKDIINNVQESLYDLELEGNNTDYIISEN